MSSLPRVARKLVFYTYPHDLTRDTTLLLSFMSTNPQELYKELYPTAWRVLRMSGGNAGTSASALYSARLAFGVKQSAGQKVTIPQTHIEIGASQLTLLDEQTTLTDNLVDRTVGKSSSRRSWKIVPDILEQTQLSTNAEGFVHWSDPVGQPAVGSDKNQVNRTFRAINITGDQKDICIGSIDAEKLTFRPMICWPRVNNGATAAVDFLPHLHVHAYSGLKETDLIRGKVESLLGAWDLSQLQNAPTENRFHLYEDKTDGERLRLVKD